MAMGCVGGGIWLPKSWSPEHWIFAGCFLIIVISRQQCERPLTDWVGGVMTLCDILVLYLRSQGQMDLFHLLLQPFWLLVTWVLMNHLVEGQKHRQARLREQEMQSRALLQQRSRSYETLLAIHEALERQSDGFPAALTTLSTKLTALWESSGQQREAVLLETILRVVGANSCALYSKEDQCLELSALAESERSSYSYQRRLEVNDPIIEQVLRGRQACTRRDGQGGERAVLAGPLIEANGEISAVLVIAELPVGQFSPAAERLLGALLHFMRLALEAESFSRRAESEGKVIALPVQPRRWQRGRRLALQRAEGMC